MATRGGGSLSYDFPIYCAAWLPLAHILKPDPPAAVSDADADADAASSSPSSPLPPMAVLRGGGGEGRSGGPNKLVVAALAALEPAALSPDTVLEVERREKVPYRMAVHPRGDGVFCVFPNSCRLELWHDRHIEYLTRGLRHLGPAFHVSDANRPWLCYWMVHPLALLDEALDDDLENDIIDFLARCQDKDGGYSGGPGQALDLKKLQTPLYEEFYKTMHGGSCQDADQTSKGKHPVSPKLPPRGKSPPTSATLKGRGSGKKTRNLRGRE